MRLLKTLRTILTVSVIVLGTSCSAKKVVKAVYCDQRAPDGTCTKWAKHPVDCTHNAYGDCTDTTR